MSDFRTLVEMLTFRAEQNPKQRVQYLTDGVEVGDATTTTELDRAAREIAAKLQAEGVKPGDRVILCYPGSLQFVRALFGVFYAGAIAVPVYPPNPARLARTLPRLRKIAADCTPSFVLATSEIAAMAPALFPMAPELASPKWIATDAGGLDANAYKRPDVKGEDVALLQYTSGSTRTPRGVMVTGANLIHNFTLLSKGFGHERGGDKLNVVSWLPLYHDMGLIGTLLSPIAEGADVTLISPFDFLASPMKWMQAISRYGKGKMTSTGSPNFGYELCARKATDEQIASLDLSGLFVAFCGAEPVRATTMRAFADRFAPCGFKESSLLPCYGLAEGTLIVSGSPRTAPVVRKVDAEALREQRIAPPSGQALELVGCGEVVGQECAIVDADGNALPADTIGEIWVKGPSVGRGYWGVEAETQEIFRAHTKDGRGPFLRTGDLGFLDKNGELFITGRSKDLIIVRGLNYYPHDIEATAELAAPGLRPGCSAAFAIDADGTEGVAIVCELDGKGAAGMDDVVSAVRAAIAESHELAVRSVVLVKARQVPKTPSGKVQRSLTRKMLGSGELEVVHTWKAPEGTLEAANVNPSVLRSDDAPLRTVNEISDFLVAWLCEYFERKDITPGTSFAEMGLDSLATVQLMEAFSARVGQELSATLAIDYVSIEELAPAVVELLGDSAEEADTGIAAADTPIVRGGGAALSYEQQSMLDWLVERPKCVVWNMNFVAKAKGKLDHKVFERAFRAVLARYPVLRYGVKGNVARPELGVLAPEAIDLSFVDVPADVANEQLRALGRETVDTPFAADGGPLLRARLVRIGDDENHLLTVAWHSLVADVGIRGTFLKELTAYVDAFSRGETLELPDVTLHHSDFATWQRAWSEGPGASRVAAAQRRVAAFKAVDTPTTFPRPDRISGEYHDSFYEAKEGTLPGILKRCAAAAVTPFGGLLGVLGVLLRVAASQDRVTVVSVLTQRNLRDELRRCVGNLGNVVVHGLDLSGVKTVSDVLARAHASTLDAMQFIDVHSVPTLGRVDYLTSPLCRVMLNGPNLAREGGGGEKPATEPSAPKAVTFENRFLQPAPGIRTELVFSGHEVDNQGYVGWANGASDVFDAPAVAALCHAWRASLEAFGAGAELGEIESTIRAALAKK